MIKGKFIVIWFPLYTGRLLNTCHVMHLSSQVCSTIYHIRIPRRCPKNQIRYCSVESLKITMLLFDLVRNLTNNKKNMIFTDKFVRHLIHVIGINTLRLHYYNSKPEIARSHLQYMPSLYLLFVNCSACWDCNS